MLINGDRLPLQLEGRHNARNLLLAVAVADQLEVSRKALEQMQVMVPGGRNRRLQLGGLTLLDETYNASPEAVLAALDLLASQPGRRFAVLGCLYDMVSYLEGLQEDHLSLSELRNSASPISANTPAKDQAAQTPEILLLP